MTATYTGTRHTPATAGRLHSPRLPRPAATREHRATRRQEHSHQKKPMNAPRPNTKTHRLFPVPERRCSQRQQAGLHPAQTPPHTPRAGQPAPAATQVTGGELRHATSPPAVRRPAVAPATGDEFTDQARPDDAVGISRWRGRRTPVNPPCPVHRETSSQAPAHKTAGAGTDAGLPGHLLRTAFRDDQCRPSAGAQPCRAVDIDRVQQRDAPAEHCPDTERKLLTPPADGQPYRTRPPTAAGRPPRPKVRASRGVSLPHDPVASRTLPRAATGALRPPAQRRGHARGSTTRRAADAPVPTTASHEQAAPIAEAGMKADAFEGVV